MSTISGATLSTISSILKDDYMGPIREMLNHKVLLLHRLQRTTEYTQGKRAFVPLHTKRNQGVGSRPEASTSSASNLPVPGKQGFNEAVYNMAYHYGSVQFTGPAIAAARDAEGSFARLVEIEVEGMMTDCLRDQNRQCFTAKSGSLGAIVTLPTGTNTIDASTNGTGEYQLDDVRHFQIDMPIQLLDISASNAVLGAATDGIYYVIAIDDTNNTITVSATEGGAAATIASGTPVAGDIFVKSWAHANEMFGLLDAVSDSNPTNILSSANTALKFFGSLDRSSAANAFWKSRKIDKANSAFGDKIFRDLINNVERYSQGKVSLLLTTYELYDTYGTQLLVDRRFNTAGSMFQQLDGGFESLDYNGIPVVKERDCPNGYIYGLDESSLMILEMSDWDWMDKDGAMLSRVRGKDAYEATLFCYRELGSSGANRCSYATRVAVSA